jgi:hypothetical protein
MRLAQLIADLRDARQEFYQVAFGQDAQQTLGEPCTESHLGTFERQLGYTLPPSYRELLLLHNGWQGFQGDADLLSLIQHGDKGTVRRIESLRRILREQKKSYNPDNLLIVGGNDSTYTVYLDLDTRRPDGEMDVVEYGYEEGELARHSDMISYLESQLADIRDLIKDEKGTAAGEER